MFNVYDDLLLHDTFRIIQNVFEALQEEKEGGDKLMDNNGKFGVSDRQIIIRCANEEEMLKIKEQIHYQLVGNQDYIDCNIVLNGSDDRLHDETENEVHVYFFEECKNIPNLEIKF